MLEFTSPLEVLAVMAEARRAPVLFSDSMVIVDPVVSASSHFKAELECTTSYQESLSFGDRKQYLSFDCFVFSLGLSFSPGRGRKWS